MPLTVTLWMYMLLPAGGVAFSVVLSKLSTEMRVLVRPEGRVCVMVYDETKGTERSSCVLDCTGYSPRRWKTRREAMAPESSLPGIPRVPVLKLLYTTERTRRAVKSGRLA